MNKLYDTQLPPNDLLTSFRLFSNNGVSYFGKNEEVFLDLSMVDKVDQPIRILCNLLLKLECRVCSFYCGVENNKEAFKELWNNIKREEKQIRSDGLILRKLDGTSVSFKDGSYRVYWPSFESFVYEYPKSSTSAWLCIDIPVKMEQQRSIIKSRSDIFNVAVTTENKCAEYERFNFILDSGDLLINRNKWRRITENLVTILMINSEIIV